ncbi:hypothetical protein [Granulicella arctica]|uniref:Uncharacterized protein n=1 Tax=Granulicella arctica TaxID=940613 RepID=A0A7Y9PH59_9BACT|nr:hypothetical protein [Granulicella arctica]NYF79757.1 hypothetical protein [Granulicella arctica]
MKRPVGLILSTLTLGLAALGMLLFAGLMVFAGFQLRTHPVHPPPPPFIGLFLYALGFVFAAIVAMVVTTLVGLLFLRSWARYAILVFGGILSCFGAFSLLGALAILVAGSHGMALPPQPGVNPQQLHHIFTVVFALCAIFYAAVAAIGAWWLVYFNQRSTKDLFSQRSHDTGLLVSPVSSSRRPTAITILGCLLLVGAASCAGLAFLPFPAFMLGFIASGNAAHALYAGLALVTLLTGVGLLKLHPAARIVAMAMFAVGGCNTLLSVLPWYQNQFRAYMQQFLTAFPMPSGAPPSTFQYPAAQMMVSGIFGLAINGFLIWLLHRHRIAFSAPPPIGADAPSN